LEVNFSQVSMPKSFPLLICAAVATAGSLHAQSPTEPSGGPASYRADEFIGTGHLGQSRGTILRPALDLSEPRASFDHPYASPYASAPSNHGEARTAIDHRFAPDGLAGSVGFVCDNDGHPPAPHEDGVMAGSQEGRLIGTTLTYPFK
jgi:hypothetical protein